MKEAAKANAKIIHTHYEFNFDLVLENELSRPLFVKHINNELNGELFDFCTQVELYRKSPTKHLAMEIYTTYVKEQSKKEINIPQILRYQVETNVNDLQQQVEFVTTSVGEEAAAVAEKVEHARKIFDECYDQVRMSLYNSFGRFKRSKEFIAFVTKSNDQFLRTIGKHKSEIQNIELNLDNFTIPVILASDVAFAQELTQDYYYWRPIYFNKSLNMTYYNGYGKHKFYSEDVFKKMGFLLVMKNEFHVQQSALQTLRGLFCERYRTKALGLNNMTMVEYFKNGNEKSRLPTTVYQAKLFCGALFQLRDIVCAISSFYDAPSKSYFVIMRSCEHPKTPEKVSLLGHYYFIYRAFDLGSECKLQMIAMANSHGSMETQKPGMMYDFLLQLGAPELCKKQAKHVLLMQSDPNQTFDDDTNIMQMINDHKAMNMMGSSVGTPTSPLPLLAASLVNQDEFGGSSMVVTPVE